VKAVPKSARTAVRSPAPALERGFRILEQLAASRRGLTLSDLARHLHLAKSTCHHLLTTLLHLGYVNPPDAAGRYFAAMKLADLGGHALSSIRLRSQSAPLLRELQGATGLTVHLAIWEQGEVVLVEKVATTEGPRLATWIGRRMDAHCTGCGKAILAHLPEAELERHIREHGLPKHNENTLASPRRLRLSLATVRESGFSIDDEEDELGYRCLGVPVHEDGAVVAAISVAGSVSQVRPDNYSHLGKLLISTARRVSALLSGPADGQSRQPRP
jgi:DNA-binding IclR family transcriptional regulator